MAPHACLHCHLIDAINDWQKEYKNDPEASDRAYIVQSVVKVLCDVIEHMSEPGKDRINGTNTASIDFITTMSARLNRAKDAPDIPRGPAAPMSGTKH